MIGSTLDWCVNRLARSKELQVSPASHDHQFRLRDVDSIEAARSFIVIF